MYATVLIYMLSQPMFLQSHSPIVSDAFDISMQGRSHSYEYTYYFSHFTTFHDRGQKSENLSIPRPQDAAMTSLEKVQAGCFLDVEWTEIQSCAVEHVDVQVLRRASKNEKTVGGEATRSWFGTLRDILSMSSNWSFMWLIGPALAWLHKTMNIFLINKIHLYRAQTLIFCVTFFMSIMSIQTRVKG